MGCSSSKVVEADNDVIKAGRFMIVKTPSELKVSYNVHTVTLPLIDVNTEYEWHCTENGVFVHQRGRATYKVVSSIGLVVQQLHPPPKPTVMVWSTDHRLGINFATGQVVFDGEIESFLSPAKVTPHSTELTPIGGGYRIDTSGGELYISVRENRGGVILSPYIGPPEYK